MKHGLFYTIGIIVLSMVSVTISPAQVLQQVQPLQQVVPQTVGVPSAPGPYYAPPSWDLKLPSASRFIILSDWGNAAVLDKETGLVWERSPSTSDIVWANAAIQCNNRTVGNRKGWRLPTAQELASLVDPSVASGPRLPSGHPFANVRSYNYWSANTSALDNGYAWTLSFTDCGVYSAAKTNALPVWCVRGGQGVDAQ